MPATAPTNNHYSALVDVVTTQQFMKGEFDNVVKRNILLKKLQERGNVKFDASGKFFERNARVGEHQAQYRTADLAPRSFARAQQRVTYAVPYALREITGALSENDVMFNSGKEALVNLNKTMMKNMGEDFKRDISRTLLLSNAGSNSVFGQSAAAGSPVPFFGLPTIFGYGAAAQNYNPDTQTTSGAVAAGDKEVLPNTTYCGVTTHPTAAIAGVDGRQNEATSPVIINTTSTGFGAATWAANCLKVIDYASLRGARSQDPMDAPDLGIVTRSMFADVKAAVQTYFRIMLEGKPTSPSPTTYSENYIPWGSMSVYWDEFQPASTFYGLNTNYLEFCAFPQKKILRDGTLEDSADEMFTIRTDYDINQGGHLAVAAIAGQLWANPKFQVAGYAFA